jgi:Ca2+-dependent lipid-binding protein
MAKKKGGFFIKPSALLEGTMDPYVTVQLDGAWGWAGAQMGRMSAKTHICRKTLTPEWKETFKFPVQMIYNALYSHCALCTIH